MRRQKESCEVPTLEWTSASEREFCPTPAMDLTIVKQVWRHRVKRPPPGMERPERQFGRSGLFLAQGDQRIDRRSLAGRHETGEGCDAQENQSDGGKRRQICGAGAVQESSQQTRQQRRAGNSGGR